MRLRLAPTLVACVLALMLAPAARADHSDLFDDAIKAPLAIGDDDTKSTAGLDIQPGSG
jgi:hypothetical protein